MIVITLGRHHLGRGGRCRSSQNPGIAEIGLTPIFKDTGKFTNSIKVTEGFKSLHMAYKVS